MRLVVCVYVCVFMNVNLNGEHRACAILSRRSRMICDIFCFIFHILNRALLYFFFLSMGVGIGCVASGEHVYLCVTVCVFVLHA